MSSGENVTLQIMKIPGAFGNDAFKGFIVQGVEQGSGEILGTFIVSDNE